MPLHTNVFFTQSLWHTNIFTQKCFYLQTLLHTNTFTDRPFYTQTLLQTDPFTHRHFYAHTRFFTLLLLLLHVFLQPFLKQKKRSCLKPKNRQFGGVFVFFEASRSKKHRNYRVFLRLASPKPRYLRYLRCFFAPGSKNHGIYSVLWPAPKHLAKTVVFTEFSARCKKYFCHAKRTKHCKLQCLGFWHPMKNVRKQPKVSKLELLFQASKNGGAAAHFWNSPQPGSGLTFPNGPKSEPPPPTPPKLASLRFAYTYTQPRPSAGFRNKRIKRGIDDDNMLQLISIDLWLA